MLLAWYFGSILAGGEGRLQSAELPVPKGTIEYNLLLDGYERQQQLSAESRQSRDVSKTPGSTPVPVIRCT